MAPRQDTPVLGELQKVLLDDKDFLKTVLQESLQSILQTEFDRHINAGYYERSETRQGRRNGTYIRSLKTRVGPLELHVCRDREGSFRTELFRRYQRSEQAFLLSMIEMYLQGVSTRKVTKIVETMCGMEISKSQLSDLTKRLDQQLSLWRQRQLSVAYPYLVVDARYEKIRTDQGVISQAVLIVIGISESGHRAVLAVELGNSENESTWNETFKRLKARGLAGVKYVVSDDHQGLVNALSRQFQGALWQRCQVHFMRNLITKLSRADASVYVPMLRAVFNALSHEEALSRKEKLLSELEENKRAAIAQWIDEEIESTLTVFQLPAHHQIRMRSTNMIERLNQELRRRSRVIRIFPNEASCIRLIASLCQETSEQWETGKKYLTFDMEPNIADEHFKEQILAAVT